MVWPTHQIVWRVTTSVHIPYLSYAFIISYLEEDQNIHVSFFNSSMQGFRKCY